MDTLRITIIWILLFFSVMLFCYIIFASSFTDYATSIKRYKRKRSGVLLFVTPLIHYVINKINHFFGENNQYYQKLQEKIKYTGESFSFTAQELAAIQIIAAIAAGIISGIIGLLAMPEMGGYFVAIMAIILIGSFIGWMIPVLPINNIIETRRKLIIRDWPFFIDLLALAVGSGMDILSAIRRVVNYIPLSPLTEELMQFLNSTQLGTRRSIAMRELAERINISSIKATLEMIIQAEELGTELTPVIYSQVADFRDRQAMYAEQKAVEAPVKMLLPLLVFIFPAILVVLIGPIMINYFMSR